MRVRHYFMCGLPFVGKTTALLRTVQSLNSAYGFVTQPYEEAGKKIGLNALTADGKIFHVASMDHEGKPRIGKYFLDEKNLELVMQNVMRNSSDTKYIYLDEIGSLFCQDAFFVKNVRTLLETHTVLGVLARKGHPFIQEIHRRADCSIINLTAENRDDIPGQLINLMT